MLKKIKNIANDIYIFVEFFLWNVWKMRAGLSAGTLSFMFLVYYGQNGVLERVLGYGLFFLSLVVAYVEGWDTRIALRKWRHNKAKKMMDKLRKEFGDEAVDTALKEND